MSGTRLHQELSVVRCTRIGIPENTVGIRYRRKLSRRCRVSRIYIGVIATRELAVTPLYFIRGSRRRDLEYLVVRPGCHAYLLAAYVIQIGEIT